ncbi:restriction endonuclease [Patescibacteria group bacterium]|nr:restriction endonuclease [Patescibacteria group bacterium]MBU1890804.1 restriction endonuclease [Patescibacteria group bacterium]
MPIKKSTGDYQPFEREKFQDSLMKSGASERFVLSLSKQAAKMESRFKSSDQIHQFAEEKLFRQDKKAAIRYNLKKAVFELGPTGFPFEQYVARLLDRMGYQTQTNVYVQGYCVSHEVDVLAKKGNKVHLFECKYHTHRGRKSNVKTILYVKARFDDIDKAIKENINTNRQAPKKKIHQIWLVTNTKHTSEAEKYGKCAGVNIISWNYPAGESLQKIIEKTGLYPITVLPNLSRHLKRKLFKFEVVTLPDLIKFSDFRKFTHHEKRQIVRIKKDAEILVK